MRSGNRSPIHPGGILSRQYLEPLGLTVADLARTLGVSRKTVSKIVTERGALISGVWYNTRTLAQPSAEL